VISIRTYIGTPDDGFVSIEEFQGPFPRKGDLNGAIVFDVNGVVLLDKEMWDSIDLLWSLIVRSLHEFKESGATSTSFPDQPIFLRLKKAGRDGVRITVEWEEHRRSSYAKQDELLESIKEGAVTFFQKILSNSPPNEWKYLDRLNQAKAL
jgi:hypothetical protein